MKVVRCRLRAGVGQDAVVGVWPACWGNPEMPLPGDEMPPGTEEPSGPLFGSGFSFLNAPSAGFFLCVVPRRKPHEMGRCGKE